MPYEKVGKNEPVCIADEVPFDIPDSWEWVRLGTILYKLSDGTHSRPQYVSSGIPFISVKDVSGGKLDFSDCKYITEEEHRELYSRCNPEYGDILLTKVGTTGIPVIVDTRGEFSLFVSVALLKFSQRLLSNEYLVHLINSPLVQKQAEENTRGVGNKNWVMRDIANTLIVIPPLLEQQRIVSKLQEILPFADNYAVAYSKADELNKRFPGLLKKSILQEAVQGKLVPQDPADEPASVLLERIRAEKEQLIKAGKIKRDKHESVIFRRDNSHYEKLDEIERCIDDEIPFEIPENWGWCRLGQVTKLITKGSSPKWQGVSYTDKQNGILFITSENVGAEELLLSKEKYVGNEFNDMHPTSILQKGDLLTNIVGASIGRTAKYTLDIPNANINQAVSIIRLVDLDISDYLVKYLNSIIAIEMMTNKSVDSARANLSLTSVSNLLVPVPPLAEQKRIVKKLQFVLPLCKNV